MLAMMVLLKKMRISKARRHAIQNGYRSGFEERFNASLHQLHSLDLLEHFEYEQSVIRYTKPITHHRYTPDFVVELKSGKTLIIETKGRFTAVDRKKHLLLQDQHPELDIRFVFQNSKAKLSKASKTTYAMWCDRYGFKYADKEIPLAWLNE